MQNTKECKIRVSSQKRKIDMCRLHFYPYACVVSGLGVSQKNPAPIKIKSALPPPNPKSPPAQKKTRNLMDMEVFLQKEHRNSRRQEVGIRARVWGQGKFNPQCSGPRNWRRMLAAHSCCMLAGFLAFLTASERDGHLSDPLSTP